MTSPIQTALGEDPEGHLTLMKPQLITSLQRKFDQCCCNIVTEFSGCGLTKHTDKLIAFGSTANELEASAVVMRDVRYLAGLWEVNLLFQMVWVVTKRRSPSRRYKLGEAGYVAPSWIWASIEDSIKAASMFPDLGSNIALAAVILAKVLLATRYVYGSVKAGWLRMKGHLRPVAGSILKTRSTLSLIDQQTAAHFYFTEDTEEAYAMCRRATNIWWLPLTLAHSHDTRPAVDDSFSCHGLVLTSLTDIPSDHCFIRPSERVLYRLGICNFGRTFSRLLEDKLLMSLGTWSDQKSGVEVWKRFEPSRDYFEEFVIV
nr:hypothetical protein CFP56_34650 [Quercus suber]